MATTLPSISPDLNNCLRSHPQIRLTDFTPAQPSTEPTYEGTPPGVEDILNEWRAKALRPDPTKPKRFHPKFYESVGRIRSQHVGMERAA